MQVETFFSYLSKSPFLGERKEVPNNKIVSSVNKGTQTDTEEYVQPEEWEEEQGRQIKEEMPETGAEELQDIAAKIVRNILGQPN